MKCGGHFFIALLCFVVVLLVLLVLVVVLMVAAGVGVFGFVELITVVRHSVLPTAESPSKMTEGNCCGMLLVRE